ncbi:MAG TPA: glycoside hydrolase family 2 TIM barrel-domain containing protein [Candidatus Sulfotelmatobacter sp.]|nr:glycoside hydrolase family 2 TIM barrel-domain containing protein [Candidatus Sulfotelmatobacter sp.]
MRKRFLRDFIRLLFVAWTAVFWPGWPNHLAAEVPGEFRPGPVDHPTEIVGATGTKIQPPDTLPKSRAPLLFNPARQTPSDPASPQLLANELIFNAGWKLAEESHLTVTNGELLSQPGVDTHDWYDATVPGTVLTTLVNDGVYPNPYYGLNNLLIPESLNKQDYWYREQFALPASFTGRELWLNFNGINYYAEIWLNGTFLGHITGAFIRGQFNVTHLVKPTGTNVIAVMIAPPPDPGIPSEQSDKFGPGDNGGKLCLDGPTFVCTEGWDWIPAIRDRDSGLWQDVILRATGPVTIGDPQVITALPLPDTSRSDITIETDLHNVSGSPQAGVLKGSFEGVRFEQPVTLLAGETKTIRFSPANFPQLIVRHPRLWWPNGYGKPELYHLQLHFVTSDGQESDENALHFGIREMSYELALKMPDGKIQRMEFTPTLARGEAPVIDTRRNSIGWKRTWDDDPKEVAVWPRQEHSPALKPLDDDAMGPYLIIKVNGKRIFCNGGNWGMDDAMKRISREHLEPYIRLERDANLTMIRNWSGQSTSETFYDLCDEYGILVWNDFWMDTEGWNYAPYDHKLFLANVADTIRRYRNHPCIAIWCAMNEGVPPADINQGNDELVRTLDGTRYYQPNSRSVNLRTSGPWSNLPLDRYFDNLNDGFSTEMGASSIPSEDVMRSIMSPPDLWPPGDLWAYHDFHTKGAGNRYDFLRILSRRYGDVTNLDDLCRKAQMVNYETYRAIYEGFDSRLWDDCSGVLLWMSHPSWPSVVWQLYSWDYEPNASYFGAKKAGEPVHIQMNLPDCQVAVINHHFTPLPNATADAVIYDLSGIKVQSYHTNFTASANACTDLFNLPWPSNGTYLVELKLRGEDRKLLSQNFYWHARTDEELRQLNSLPEVKLNGSLRCHNDTDGTIVDARVANTSKSPALAIKLTLRDAETGDRILPAYYQDDFFSLLPGESRKIRIKCPSVKDKVRLDLSGWNIQQGSIL